MEVSIANDEWPARLAKAFPVGTPETALVSTLRTQAFEVDEGGRRAKAHWAKGFCNHDVDVSWQVNEEAKITSIEGRYFPACP